MRSNFISKVITAFGLMLSIISMTHCSSDSKKSGGGSADSKVCPSNNTMTNTNYNTNYNTVANTSTGTTYNTGTNTSTNTGLTLSELEEMYLADATITVPSFAEVTALLNKYQSTCKLYTPTAGTEDCSLYTTVSANFDTYLNALRVKSTVPLDDLKKLMAWSSAGKPNTTTSTVTNTSTETATNMSTYNPYQAQPNANTNCQ